MITGHLQERTFATWALDPTDAVATAHINECEACRREAVDFRCRVATFREALVAAGEARPLAWTAPHTSETEPKHDSLTFEILTWAPRLVLATLVLAFAIMTFRPKPVATPPAANPDDQALMTQIEEDLSRPAPEALAPAEVAWSETSTANGTNEKVGN